MRFLKLACPAAVLASALVLSGSRTIPVRPTDGISSPGIGTITRVADGLPWPKDPIPGITRVADGLPWPKDPIPGVTRVADGLPWPKDPIPGVA
jgi:hypothetical protein